MENHALRYRAFGDPADVIRLEVCALADLGAAHIRVRYPVEDWRRALAYFDERGRRSKPVLTFDHLT